MSRLVLTPSKPQARVLRSPARFKVLNAGRRFGKTFLAIDLFLFPRAVNMPGSIHWYVAPTYRSAEQIAWEALKAVVPKGYVLHKDESDLSIMLKNRATIALRGSDKPDSLRGPGLDSVAGEEWAFQGDGVWKVLRPSLSDRKGQALFISSPNGFNHFHDLYMSAKEKPDWASWSFTKLPAGVRGLLRESDGAGLLRFRPRQKHLGRSR